jgi:adenine phosphoribosyltransferase
MIENKLKESIKTIQNFPKKGISFKDITPLFKDHTITDEILNSFKDSLSDIQVDAVVGVESRGFVYGMMLANKLKVPFIPIRKKGKLPSNTISQSYKLEYGEATIEMHIDSLKKNWNVVVHDDLLATGGTAIASSKIIEKLGANVCAYAFVVELEFLNGREKLSAFSKNIISLIKY